VNKVAKEIPADRFFTSEHEWTKIKDKEAIIGISDHAQHQLGDVVYIELPEKGTEISKGSAIGVIESVKAVSDIYSPLSGTICEVNKNAIDNPEIVNQDPYGEAWLFKINLSNEEEKNDLLDKNAYEELLLKEAK
jgi:glycine cleavage system H protein